MWSNRMPQPTPTLYLVQAAQHSVAVRLHGMSKAPCHTATTCCCSCSPSLLHTRPSNQVLRTSCRRQASHNTSCEATTGRLHCTAWAMPCPLQIEHINERQHTAPSSVCARRQHMLCAQHCCMPAPPVTHPGLPCCSWLKNIPATSRSQRFAVCFVAEPHNTATSVDATSGRQLLHSHSRLPLWIPTRAAALHPHPTRRRACKARPLPPHLSASLSPARRQPALHTLCTQCGCMLRHAQYQASAHGSSHAYPTANPVHQLPMSPSLRPTY
ncbi:hypothetical protein COO60DRAFT_545486 [Scenedesmus sp. NREL 46B-D3]|nr:hypothetical protein COO60DRAFT_545486 [Scenedesmus sp. NREL 46B-D3]